MGNERFRSDSTQRRMRPLPNDQTALWQITGKWRPYLKAVAKAAIDERLVGKVDASDVVQAALAAAVQRFSAFRGKTIQDWQGWIVAIVRNEARQVQRHWRQQRRDECREQPLAVAGLDENSLPADDSSASHKAQQREQATHLFWAISQLSEEDRQIIELRHFAGLAYEQAAQRMGISAVAARKLWGRALLRLRDKLDNDGGELG